MSTRPHTYLTRRYFFLLLILSLAICSCGGDKDEATQPPAKQDVQASGAGPAAPPETGGAGGEEMAQQPSVEGAANLNDLDSYRMRLTTRLLNDDGSWGSDETMEMTWVRETQANHIIMYDPSGNPGMEMISIGDTTWLNMGATWVQADAPQEDRGASPPVDLESLLQDIQGGMALVGEETVNDVHCKHYTVDTEFSVELSDPSGIARTLTGHIKGDVWQADQSGLPPVVIRSQTETELAMFEGHTMTLSEERDVYDINVPTTIEPPAEVAEMPGLPTTLDGQPASPEIQPQAPALEGADAPLQVADLQNLNSYRLSMTSRVQSSGAPVVEVVLTEEWVREPPARRLAVSLGAGMPEMEYIVIGNSAWMNLGGNWMTIPESEVEDLNEDLSSLMTPDPGMALVGEETVNGIHCKHYIQDVETDSQSVHHEMWVANQDGFPEVAIRAIYRLEMNMGEMTTVTEGEVNVTDINTLITIEPPQ